MDPATNRKAYAWLPLKLERIWNAAKFYPFINEKAKWGGSWKAWIIHQSARDVKWTSFVRSKLVRSSQEKKDIFWRLFDVFLRSLENNFCHHLNAFELQFKFLKIIVSRLFSNKHFNFMILTSMTLFEGIQNRLNTFWQRFWDIGAAMNIHQVGLKLREIEPDGVWMKNIFWWKNN